MDKKTGTQKNLDIYTNPFNIRLENIPTETGDFLENIDIERKTCCTYNIQKKTVI